MFAEADLAPIWWTLALLTVGYLVVAAIWAWMFRSVLRKR